MSIQCNPCDGTGFKNTEQLPEELLNNFDIEKVLLWIRSNTGHDVCICDCCGDGEGWYGVPGEHYNAEDPVGSRGPYAGNGGLCKCH